MLSIFRQFEPTTAAKATPLFESHRYDSITVAADALSGAETVTLQVDLDGTLVQVTDLVPNAINLTETRPAVTLEGGPNYVFTKSVTASPCAIYIIPKLK